MMAANNISLRDRRRAELLHEIQQAAHRLFAERGFAAVTTEDIAAAAGISIRTYFRHASTTEDLLVAPVRQAVAETVNRRGSPRPMIASSSKWSLRAWVSMRQSICAVASGPHRLATARFLLRRWLSMDAETSPELHVQLEEALGTSECAFHDGPAACCVAGFTLGRTLRQPYGRMGWCLGSSS